MQAIIMNKQEEKELRQRIFREFASKGGKARAKNLSKKRKSQIASDAAKARWKNNRPALKKCRYFESVFPYPLENNEWKYKFPLSMNGRKTTYNPDYFCPKLGCYIEVATSKPNIAEQRLKWNKCINMGLKLKVYWWQGNEITKEI